MFFNTGQDQHKSFQNVNNSVQFQMPFQSVEAPRQFSFGQQNNNQMKNKTFQDQGFKTPPSSKKRLQRIQRLDSSPEPDHHSLFIQQTPHEANFAGMESIANMIATPGLNLPGNTAKTRKSLARFDAIAEQEHATKPESKNLSSIFEKESKRKQQSTKSTDKSNLNSGCRDMHYCDDFLSSDDEEDEADQCQIGLEGEMKKTGSSEQRKAERNQINSTVTCFLQKLIEEQSSGQPLNALQESASLEIARQFTNHYNNKSHEILSIFVTDAPFSFRQNSENQGEESSQPVQDALEFMANKGVDSLSFQEETLNIDQGDQSIFYCTFNGSYIVTQQSYSFRITFMVELLENTEQNYQISVKAAKMLLVA